MFKSKLFILVIFLFNNFNVYAHEGHDHDHHLAWLVHAISALVVFSALASVVLLIKYIAGSVSEMEQRNAI
jgi:hypothetical protein